MPNRIREVRKLMGMTMKQLGIEIGVAESTVSQYETGKREPDNETLLRIGELFNVTVGYLLGAEEQKEPPTTLANSEGLRSTDYDKLNEANRAIIDDLIAKLVKAQSEE